MSENAKLDDGVDAIAKAMKEKLQKKLEDGYSGWDSSDWDLDDIRRQLIEHAEKDDYVDVANFAMFAYHKMKSNKAGR